MKRLSLLRLAAAVLLTASAACTVSSRRDHAAIRNEAVPREPDYTLASQWYTADRGGAADIFYIPSTSTFDYRPGDSTWCHYADTYTDSLRRGMTLEMQGVDLLIGGNLNFRAPYYRQCSMESFTGDSLRDARLELPAGDVRRAFAHYLTRINPDRPFILAGFSQGAFLALRLMEEMDDAAYARMVAAYLIGIPVPSSRLAACPRIRAARGADDTGVTVCYNSVRDASCADGLRSALCINPVNWSTGGEPAVLDTEPSPFIPLDRQQKQHLEVALDTASNLLFVSGYVSDDYILPLFGREGNYHSREIWLYRQQLRDNMQNRVNQFLKQ